MNETPCKHLDSGECQANPGLHPSALLCLRYCSEYDGPPRGVGDRVHTVITRATLGKLKPCGGCEGRRQRWNRRSAEKKLAQLSA